MDIIFNSLKLRKYKIQSLIFFSLFLIIYFILDYLNMSYPVMISQYGVYLVVINVVLNIVMSFLSAILLTASEIMIRSSKSSNLGFFAIIFGIFTYGCTTCLIAFFANFGIVLSVLVLPLAGLPYKLISLTLILLGIFIANRQLNKGCKIKQTDN